MVLPVALALALQAGAPGSLTFDVRCMVTTGLLARSTDADERRAGEVASQYYFGRLDARIPDDELEAAILRETQGMRDDEQAQRLQACGTFLQQRGQRLTEVGNRMSARESAAQAR